MEFVQRQLRVKFRREWRDSESLGYRVTWRRKAFGIRVKPAFYAAVRVVRLTDGHQSWDFAQHRRPYKTFKAAVEACVRNKKTWDKFIELGGAQGNRITRLQDLIARGRVGGGNILGSMPKWIRGRADEALLRMLYPRVEIACELYESDQSDPIETSTSTDSETNGGGQPQPKMTPPSGRASNAKVKAGTTTPKTETSSKGTSSLPDELAPTATEQVAAPAKQSAKRTKKPSGSGRKNSKPSSPKKATVKPASTSSRKKNAKR